MKRTELNKRLKFVFKNGDAWVFEVSEEFSLKHINQQLNGTLDEFVRLEIEIEELIVRPEAIDFIDLGYELIGSY